jgi:hypothetical protein
MKILKWVAWFSVAMAAILILLAVFCQVFHLHHFHVMHNVSFVHAANSFLLLSIAMFIATKKCCNCDCKTKDEK